MWLKAVMKWVRTMGQNVQNVMKCDERLWRSELDRGVRFCIKKEDRIAEDSLVLVTIRPWSVLNAEKEERERIERIEKELRKNWTRIEITESKRIDIARGELLRSPSGIPALVTYLSGFSGSSLPLGELEVVTAEKCNTWRPMRDHLTQSSLNF